jgi:hypothetical protein
MWRHVSECHVCIQQGSTVYHAVLASYFWDWLLEAPCSSLSSSTFEGGAILVTVLSMRTPAPRQCQQSTSYFLLMNLTSCRRGSPPSCIPTRAEAATGGLLCLHWWALQQLVGHAVSLHCTQLYLLVLPGRKILLNSNGYLEEEMDTAASHSRAWPSCHPGIL